LASIFSYSKIYFPLGWGGCALTPRPPDPPLSVWHEVTPPAPKRILPSPISRYGPVRSDFWLVSPSRWGTLLGLSLAFGSAARGRGDLTCRHLFFLFLCLIVSVFSLSLNIGSFHEASVLINSSSVHPGRLTEKRCRIKVRAFLTVASSFIQQFLTFFPPPAFF